MNLKLVKSRKVLYIRILTVDIIQINEINTIHGSCNYKLLGTSAEYKSIQVFHCL